MAATATFTTLSQTVVLSNIGPLTTTFTPPPSCLTSMYELSDQLELGVPSQTDCFPPGYTTTTSSIGYYSPGVCPSGYYAASPQRPGFLGIDESGSYCCPSGFLYPTRASSLDLLGSCSKLFPTPTTTALTTYWRVWAPAIVVVWKSADFPTSHPTVAVSDPTTAVPGPTAAPQPSQHSITTTAISIIVPLVVIIMVLLAFILYRRRGRRGTETTDAIPELAADWHVVHEMHETQGATVYEMQDAATGGATEMPAGQIPVELSAGR